MSALEQGAPAPAARDGAAQARLPPITGIAVATLTLIVIGGIYLAANMPAHVSLTPAIVLLAAAVALLLMNVAMLARVPAFAWGRFFTVLRWALLAYVVIAGMLAYVFIYDGVRGATLGVLSGMLVVFGLDVPLILAFTVARFTGED